MRVPIADTDSDFHKWTVEVLDVVTGEQHDLKRPLDFRTTQWLANARRGGGAFATADDLRLILRILGWRD